MVKQLLVSYDKKYRLCVNMKLCLQTQKSRQELCVNKMNSISFFTTIVGLTAS